MATTYEKASAALADKVSELGYQHVGDGVWIGQALWPEVDGTAVDIQAVVCNRKGTYAFIRRATSIPTWLDDDSRALLCADMKAELLLGAALYGILTGRGGA